MKTETYKIIEKIKLNHDTYKIKVYKKDLPESKVSCFAKIFKNDHSKPYSPIEISDDTLTFLIKRYEEGIISSFVTEKEEGDTLEISYPLFKDEFKVRNNVLMIAGGTGIAPMLQILIHAKKNNLTTNFTVMFFNKTDEDIFYKEELEKLAKMIYFVEKGSYFIGIPSYENIKKVVEDDKFDYVYVCGPPGMMSCVCGRKNIDKTQGELQGILKELGFNEGNVYKF